MLFVMFKTPTRKAARSNLSQVESTESYATQLGPIGPGPHKPRKEARYNGT